MIPSSDDHRDAVTDQLGGVLQQRIGGLARTIDLREGSVDAVRRRGEQRRRRNRAAVGGIAAVAVVTTVVGGIAILSRPLPPSASGNAPADAAAPDGSTFSSDSAASTDIPVIPAVEAAITWNVVRPDSPEAIAYPSLLTPSTSLDGPVYAWSSQPGKAAVDDYEATLYRSDDGVAWSRVDGSDELPGKLTVGTFEGGLYSLGTSAPTKLAFWTSEDGAAWTEAAIPLDLAAWSSRKGVDAAYIGETSVSATAGSVLVLARTNLQFDTSAVASTDDSVSVTPSGVEVTRYRCTEVTAGESPVSTIAADATSVASGDATTDPVASVGTAQVCDPITGEVEHYGLDAAGIDPAAVAEQYEVHLFRRDADGSFTELALPDLTGTDSVVSSARVVAVGDRHVLIYDEIDPTTYGLVATHVLLSDDGVTWADRSLPSTSTAQAWGLTPGVLPDGRLAVLDLWGANGMEPMLWTSGDEGITWTSLRLDGLLRADDGVSARFAPSSGIVDGTGITVVAAIAIDPVVEHGPISIERDGQRVSLVDSAGVYTFTDLATGEEIARIDLGTIDGTDTSSVRYDDDGTVVLLDPADSSEIARLTSSDMDQISTLAWGDGQPYVVLHSADGSSWSRESLDDVTGVDRSVPSLAYSVDGRIIVTVLDGSGRNADGSAQTVVAVGTPTG